MISYPLHKLFQTHIKIISVALHEVSSGPSMHRAILLAGTGLHYINCFQTNFNVVTYPRYIAY